MNIYIIFLIITICLILLFMPKNNLESFQPETNNMSKNNKPIIWSYWECKPGTTRPSYIDLCFDTIYKYNKDDFDIIILDEKTVLNYLELPPYAFDKLLIAQKTDYIRIALLYFYGGIWVDADTIVMRNLYEIIDKLNEGYDFVGFGCSYNICNKEITGYPKPSNWVLASKKNGILMKRVLGTLNETLKNKDIKDDSAFGYFDLGKYIIWQEIDKLQKEIGYKYYHYNSSYDGSRDNEGQWINASNHMSETPTKFLNENNIFFTFLENSGFMKRYKWFTILTKEEIMNGPWWVSQLFRKSLLNS